MELNATCQRYDGWWIVAVPAVRGLHTQVRRLDQVEPMIKDAAALLLDRPESDFTVTVSPQLDESTTAAVAEVTRAREQLRTSEDTAARANRTAATRLAAQGLTIRDIGAILGVSHQRAHQLISA
ncbi:MAG: hypothetical protein LBI33_14435 [Propionibacteriaceae bacterium]|jgi:DNA-directed RNA polymerase specialized sigma24 family protein|nr:hypothetical protein [Propionibacteriaceae bacterium]